MSYPSHLAATLSGASLRQLQYWRETELLAPELKRSGGRVRYSFRDVLALRSFVFLREEWSLPAIRTAVSNLRAMGNLDHLSSYSLVSVGDDIVLVDKKQVMSLRARPGHMRMHEIVMANVFRPFTNLQGATIVDLQRPRPLLLVDPETQGGYPVIAGTRIEFDIVAGLVNDGVPPAEIAEFYPSVNADAAVDAAEFQRLVTLYKQGKVPSAA